MALVPKWESLRSLQIGRRRRGTLPMSLFDLSLGLTGLSVFCPFGLHRFSKPTVEILVNLIYWTVSGKSDLPLAHRDRPGGGFSVDKKVFQVAPQSWINSLGANVSIAF